LLDVRAYADGDASGIGVAFFGFVASLLMSSSSTLFVPSPDEDFKLEDQYLCPKLELVEEGQESPVSATTYDLQ